MEILYLKGSGRIIAVKPDHSPWGAGEASEGKGVGPFGLLHTSKALPDYPRSQLRVRSGKIVIVDPDPVEERPMIEESEG